MPESEGVGGDLAAAIAAKDRTALLALLDDSVEFRALTPGRNWSADDAETAADEIIFGSWFTDADHIEALESVDTGEVNDRHRVAYRLRITNDGQPYLCEQQAYYEVRDGRIGWLRILCSGFRPTPAEGAQL